MGADTRKEPQAQQLNKLLSRQQQPWLSSLVSLPEAGVSAWLSYNACCAPSAF